MIYGQRPGLANKVYEERLEVAELRMVFWGDSVRRMDIGQGINIIYSIP